VQPVECKWERAFRFPEGEFEFVHACLTFAYVVQLRHVHGAREHVLWRRDDVERIEVEVEVEVEVEISEGNVVW
jgi:hypothetical protein